jgi:hypothetical protein
VGEDRLELKREGLGEFNDRKVRGWHYMNERGQIGWLIRIWPNDTSVPVDEYWIENRMIREIGGTPSHFKIGHVIDEMEDAKRCVIFDAIAQGEAEGDTPRV